MLRSADRLFRRFQETGDPRFLGAVFDRTSVELLRVALHLTRDPHRAEDLVQSTFLTAIEKAPQYDTERRVLPWLLTILANHARMAHRKESRPLPEAVANAAGRTGDVVEQASARELAGVCERALDALPEPYRHVLILHLRHGMSGQEIAHAMACPDSTVRNQLARGLDLLRRRLPAGIASAALLTVGRGLAAVRAEVMARAPVGVGAAAVGVPVVLGALFMSNKVAVALVCVALAVGGAWYSGLLSSVPPQMAQEATTLTAVAAAQQSKADVHQDSARDRERVEVVVPTATSAASGVAEIAVVVRDDGSAAPSLPFEVWTFGQSKKLMADGVTESDGTVRLAELAVGNYCFKVIGRSSPYQPTGALNFEIKAGQTTHSQLQIDRGWRLAGIVVNSTGKAVANAEVRAYGEPSSALLGRTAADGTFVAPLIQGEISIWAVASGRQPSKRLRVQESTAPVRLVVGDSGVRLSGRVIDEHDNPVARAMVCLGVDIHAGTPFAEREGHDVRTGEDGAFVVDWLPPGDLFVGAMPPDSDRDRATGQWLDLEVGVAATVTLHLGDGARVTGRVCDEQGNGVPDLTVMAYSHRETGLRMLKGENVMTDTTGRFSIAGLLPCPHLFTVSQGEISVEIETELHRGQEFSWNPTLSKGRTITVRLFDPAGKPMANHPIELRRPDLYMSFASTVGRTDAEGACRFDNRGPFDYTARALEPSATACLAEQAVARQQVEVVLRVAAERLPSAHIRGRVVDARGNPVIDCQVGLTVDHQGHELRLDREAHFATELLPPGNYTVSLESSNTALGWARVNLELTAGQDRNLGDLVLPDTASIAVHLQAADGSRATGAILRIDAAEWQSSENLQPDEVDGIYRKVGIDAGKHVVRCFAPDAVPQSVPIELIGGQQRELEITVRRGVPVVIELRCGPEPRPSGILNGTLTVTDATGAQLVVHSLWGYYDDFWQKIKRVRCGLLPGTYHVDVKTWKTGALDITVPESGTPAPFVIDLR